MINILKIATTLNFKINIINSVIRTHIWDDYIVTLLLNNIYFWYFIKIPEKYIFVRSNTKY